MSKELEEQKNTEDKKKSSDDLEMLNMDDIDKKKKRKRTAFDYVRYVVMGAAAVVFVVAAYNLYSIFSEYKKGEQEYERVVDSYTKVGEDAADEEGDQNPIEVSGVVVNPNFEKVSVDFAGLQSANPDVKGWIQFEGVPEISYPILQHPSDNEYYLTKMWNHEDNTAGSIFMDISNNDDFQDYNTFIYGHNMKNLSMFGRLKEYKKQEFLAGKEYFWIYTPTMNYQYQIFAIHEVKVEDERYFKTFETMGDQFTQYVADCKADSRYDTGVGVGGSDRIVTLSTCTASGDNWRLFVQGKLIGFERRHAEDLAPTQEAAPAEEVPQPEGEMPEGIIIQQDEPIQQEAAPQ